MHYATLAKFVGLLLVFFSLGQLPPVLVDLLYQEAHWWYFLLTFVITFSLGAGMYLPFRADKHHLRIRESIFLVVSFWLVLSLIATLPFMLSPALNLSFIDSFFESMSGLSTTGATVLTGLDELPKALLYYRQQLQWFGGIGIIVLAVAILPIFGISNLGLFKAENTNITHDRINPKLASTAKSILVIYIVLTLLCAIAYYIAGMGAFDALTHSFSTVAIGGFSTHDASIAYFNSPSVEIVAIVFMLLAGVNFSLHYFAIYRRTLTTYTQDSEFKAYTFIMIVLSIVTIITLLDSGLYSMDDTIRYAIFEVVSFATTTGFGVVDFSVWPLLLPFLLIFASFIGACSGSTGGGLKVIRALLMIKLGMREIKKTIHPTAQIDIKLGTTSLSQKLLVSIWGFFALYVMSFTVIMILLMFTGLDQVTSFSATAATINNLGPGLGAVAENYSSISDFAKAVLTFAMLLGRLEILTLLAIFHRAFWRF